MAVPPLDSLASCGLGVALALLLGGTASGQAEPPAQAGKPAEGGDSKAEAAQPEEKEKQSPWLFVPTFSKNPKLGAAFGLTAAYIHYLDEESRPSMFGLSGQYTSTESVIASAFARASWDRDHQRLIGVLAAGNIKNDYDDYLGTGQPLKTNDQLRALVGRYLYRVYDDWFLGVQGTYTNYQLLGDSAFDDQVLDVLGLKGFESGGVGLSAYHDSRDDENSPTTGFLLNVNNIAYREWIAGSNNFEVYRVDFRDFFPHGAGNVFAVRQYNQLTAGAPAAAFAPVQLRGYTPGEYLGEYMSSIEVEERYRWAERWTSTLFAGAAVLYGDTPTGSSYDAPFPSIGAGVQYLMRPKEGMVLNLEGAAGRGGSYGIYIKFGYGW